MSENGFIQLPRTLLRNPLWIDLPPAYKEVFLVIVDHACFKPQQFDDHGIIIQLEAGELCISERELLKHCGKYISRNDIQRSIKKFILYHFVSQEVRHKKSVLKITHPDTYDLVLNQWEPKSEPNLSQTRAKLEPEKNKENKENNENKKIFLSDSIEIRLAEFLLQQIKKLLPEFKKPNLQTWAKHFDYILRIDKRGHEQTKEMIRWLYDEGPIFWRNNIQSAAKLREKWDRLTAEKQATSGKKVPKSNREMVLERFKHGEMYEGAECFIDGEAIAFQRGLTHLSVKFKEYGFLPKLESILEKFGITV